MREEEAKMERPEPGGPREPEDVPAGCKCTEVGVIPVDWDTKRLGDLGCFTKGRGIRRDEVSDDGPPCVRYGELYTHYDTFIRKLFSRVRTDVAQSALPIHFGDLLFAGSGETAEEIGRCAAYLGERTAYAGGDIIVLTPTGQNSLFLGYLMNSATVSRQKTRMGQGDAVVHISARNLADIQVTLPSEEEQTTIAEVLSDVDGLLDALDALIAKKRAVKQAAMQQLLTGKTRLPGFSREWVIRRLADCGVFRGGNGFPIKFQGNQSGDYPFFKVSDINNRGNEVSLENANHWISEAVRRILGATWFPAGSIVFAKIGAAIFLERKRMLARDSCLDNNMMAFSLTTPGYCERFFYYLFLSIEFGKLASTTALPSLSGRAIGAIGVSIPPMEEQRAIATVLSDMDAEISALEQRRDKTRAIKQGMMQELLTGRVRLVKAGAGSTLGKPRNPRRKRDVTQKVHTGVTSQGQEARLHEHRRRT